MKKNSMRSLLAAVIKRAVDDIQGINRDDHFHWKLKSDLAMAFIQSEVCEEYCLFSEIDYEALTDKAINLKQNIAINNKRGIMQL